MGWKIWLAWSSALIWNVSGENNKPHENRSILNGNKSESNMPPRKYKYTYTRICFACTRYQFRLPELFYQQCDYQPRSYTYCRPHGFVLRRASQNIRFCSSLLQLATIHSDSGTSIEATWPWPWGLTVLHWTFHILMNKSFAQRKFFANIYLWAIEIQHQVDSTR